MMTSLDMHGFSLSLMPVTKDAEGALLAPVAPFAWPRLEAFGKVEIYPLPDGLSPIQPMPAPHPARRELLRKCCEILIGAEAALNTLDSKAGDGDTGTTLATAARALISALDRLPLADLTQLYRAVGMELSQTMGGSSGVLLAIFFTAAGDASACGKDWIASLSAGLNRIRQVGGAEPGDRTMIDALVPALEALPSGVVAAAKAARKGADFTGTIRRAKAGRASYISEERLRDINDPGAEAVALLFENLSRGIGVEQAAE